MLFYLFAHVLCKKKWHFILCRLKCIHRQVLRFLIHISAGAECPHEQNKHVWTSSRSMWYIIMIHVVGYYGENIPMHHGFIGTKIIFKMTSYPRALSPSYYIPTHTKSVRSAVPILCCQPAKFKILNYSPIIVKLNAIIIRVSLPSYGFFHHVLILSSKSRVCKILRFWNAHNSLLNYNIVKSRRGKTDSSLNLCIR